MYTYKNTTITPEKGDIVVWTELPENHDNRTRNKPYVVQSNALHITDSTGRLRDYGTGHGFKILRTYPMEEAQVRDTVICTSTNANTAKINEVHTITSVDKKGITIASINTQLWWFNGGASKWTIIKKAKPVPIIVAIPKTLPKSATKPKTPFNVGIDACISAELAVSTACSSQVSAGNTQTTTVPTRHLKEATIEMPLPQKSIPTISKSVLSSFQDYFNRNR